MATAAGCRKLFVSIEGIDYTWKTAFSEWLLRDLTSQGKRVQLTRDPAYYLSPWEQFNEFFERGEDISKLAEAFLLLTARIDNCERIIVSALKQNAVVIADRYSDSWLAYQSVRLAHYFSSIDKALEYLVATQDRLISRGFIILPGLTLWISENPKTAIRRALSAAKISKYENLPMQIKVDKQYQKLHRLYPERIKKIDIRGLDINTAYSKVLSAVTNHLEK